MPPWRSGGIASSEWLKFGLWRGRHLNDAARGSGGWPSTASPVSNRSRPCGGRPCTGETPPSADDAAGPSPT
eukprot:98306-Lingulodinium_polyedra.AAC.1